MAKPTAGQMSLFGGQASTSCSAADSSGMQQNLIRPPRPPRVASELLFNDGPEGQADCTQRASTASS